MKATTPLKAHSYGHENWQQSTALVSTGGEGGEQVSGLPLGHPHLYKIRVFICIVKCIRMLRIIGYA